MPIPSGVRYQHFRQYSFEFVLNRFATEIISSDCVNMCCTGMPCKACSTVRSLVSVRSVHSTDQSVLVHMLFSTS
jgi:hypothetical protein